jgi:hypothetical protein
MFPNEVLLAILSDEVWAKMERKEGKSVFFNNYNS